MPDYQKTAWVLIRFLGVYLCGVALLGLLASVVSFGSIFAMASNLVNGKEGIEGLPTPPSLESAQLAKPLLPALITLLITIVPYGLTGLYCLFGGRFIHRIICKIPPSEGQGEVAYESAAGESVSVLSSDDHYQQPAQQTQLPPISHEQQLQQRAEAIRQERSQRETDIDRATQQRALFAQFAQQHPQEAALPPKPRYEAFRIWQEKQ